MSQYKFTPNGFASEMFNLHAIEYTGEGMENLLRQVLGTRNYREYMVPQTPLSGEKTEGEVIILLNQHVLSTKPMEFKSIGTIQRLS